MLWDRNPKIELVQEMIAANKKLNRKYNHLVDTNFKVLGEAKLMEAHQNDDSAPRIELYTTLHWGSMKIIKEKI